MTTTDADDLANLDAEELRLAVAEAAEAVQKAVDAAEGLDADPGLYHRLAAVLEALQGILADVERREEDTGETGR
jgi:hypothetical protein